MAAALDMNEDRRTSVGGDELLEPFASLVEACRPARPAAGTAPNQLGGLLASALAGRSASEAAVVEVLAAYSHSENGC
ncbi:MAG: hypothetical protein QOE58_1271 [Actinomycetota bacterium]|nr:hypothetical protein [Actinomycetota bacterium]